MVVTPRVASDHGREDGGIALAVDERVAMVAVGAAAGRKLRVMTTSTIPVATRFRTLLIKESKTIVMGMNI